MIPPDKLPAIAAKVVVVGALPSESVGDSDGSADDEIRELDTLFAAPDVPVFPVDSPKAVDDFELSVVVCDTSVSLRMAPSLVVDDEDEISVVGSFLSLVLLPRLLLFATLVLSIVPLRLYTAIVSFPPHVSVVSPVHGVLQSSEESLRALEESCEPQKHSLRPNSLVPCVRV